MKPTYLFYRIQKDFSMLKYVVFAVTEKGRQVLDRNREELEQVFAGEKTEFLIVSAAQTEESLSELRQRESLILTDDPSCLKKLQAAGFYTAGMHHEGNHDIFFEGAAYVIEEIGEITFSVYDEIYRRLAGLPLMITWTERLLIRESTIEDVAEFYRIYRDPSITKYMEDLFEDPEEEIAYMKEYIRQIYGFYGYGMWTVQLLSGEVIGRAGLSVREGYELPELGFVIDRDCQGQGYAEEACRAVLAYGKKELSFAHVQALVEEENLPSRNLLAKLGFHFDKKVNEKGTEYLLMID